MLCRCGKTSIRSARTAYSPASATTCTRRYPIASRSSARKGGSSSPPRRTSTAAARIASGPRAAPQRPRRCTPRRPPPPGDALERASRSGRRRSPGAAAGGATRAEHAGEEHEVPVEAAGPALVRADRDERTAACSSASASAPPRARSRRARPSPPAAQLHVGRRIGARRAPGKASRGISLEGGTALRYTPTSCFWRRPNDDDAPLRPGRGPPAAGPILELRDVALHFGGIRPQRRRLHVNEGRSSPSSAPTARQDERLQRHLGLYRHDRGRSASAGATSRASPGAARQARPGPLLPEHRALPRDDGHRQPHARTAHPHAHRPALRRALVRPGAARGDPPREFVEEIIDFLEIQHIRKKPVGTLAYGLQKRVELGRALALERRSCSSTKPMAG